MRCSTPHAPRRYQNRPSGNHLIGNAQGIVRNVRRYASDAAQGLLVTAASVMVGEPWTGWHGSAVLGSVFGFAMLVRNRFPGVAYPLAICGGLLGIHSDNGLFSVVIVLTGYSLISLVKKSEFIVVLSTVIVLLVVELANRQTINSRAVVYTVAESLLLGIVTATMARALRHHRVAAAHLAEHNDELRRLRSVEVDQAVVMDRARIARDLHDIVAHHVSSISVQASGARRATLGAPSPATLALESIGSSATEAMAAMRAMVGALRQPADVADPLHPQPLLSELPELIARTTSRGVQAKLTLELTETPPTAVQVSVYRIVQESLTNAFRHARPTLINVSVVANTLQVVVHVVNDGTDERASNPHGHGIRGMRERAQLLDGQFSAGPTTGNRWTVDAAFPIKNEKFP